MLQATAVQSRLFPTTFTNSRCSRWWRGKRSTAVGLLVARIGVRHSAGGRVSGASGSLLLRGDVSRGLRLLRLLEPHDEITGPGEHLPLGAQTIRANFNSQVLYGVFTLDVETQPRECEYAWFVGLEAEEVGNALGTVRTSGKHDCVHFRLAAGLERAVLEHHTNQIVHGLDVARKQLVQVIIRFGDVVFLHQQLRAETQVPSALALLLDADVLVPVVLEGPCDGQEVGPLRGGSDQHFSSTFALQPHAFLCRLEIKVRKQGVVHHAHKTAPSTARSARLRSSCATSDTVDRGSCKLLIDGLRALLLRSLLVRTGAQSLALQEVRIEELGRVPALHGPPLSRLLQLAALLHPPTLRLVQE
mmetsp:Transcript_62855/g.111072  ORF Transcript_62855/g.111072 Transcript_62855/m.111072 type:complete len:360 (-) Transcript_62855:1337-2416(-)